MKQGNRIITGSLLVDFTDWRIAKIMYSLFKIGPQKSNVSIFRSVCNVRRTEINYE